MPTKLDNGEEEFIGKEIVRIREICGPKGRVIGAVSGGVDSTVAAKLMHEAIGDRFHAIMVDNGVLRLNEAQQVNDMLNKDLGVNLTVVDASELFLSRLHGVEDPEQKRKIIGNTFINVFFETEASKIEEAPEKEENGAEAKGNNYNDHKIDGASKPLNILQIDFIMSSRPQTAVAANAKISPVFATRLASKDVNEYINTANKLKNWLGSEKAYYPDALRNIVLLFEIAHQTFTTRFLHIELSAVAAMDI
ncbi:hypothetical protein BDR07DRAFT_1484795 [Suillus spraguei]|nr:hypothetical protein BDR07DRAFT_1500849 [Suillus spraguei]KAG2354724.1 hypothetical protein BDR07DRAFT_1494202 [Suillus spraguei]KAG2362468.1 hypothetical protein BDR07DRAFT_1484795 [Suillus spraguei]